MATTRRRRLARFMVAARVLITALAVIGWFFTPARLMQDSTNQLAHLADPHAQMSHSLPHLIAIALMTAAAYLVLAITPWKSKEYLNKKHFFHKAARYPSALVTGEPVPRWDHAARARPDKRHVGRPTALPPGPG